MALFEIRRFRTALGREPFTEWLFGLSDRQAQQRILARLGGVAALRWRQAQAAGGYRKGSAAMARVQKATQRRPRSHALSVSHRERLIEELRADPELAAGYLNAAAEDG